MGKLRLTMPKKEEDIEKVVEEVYETHPEMMEEHHHHHHFEDELIIALEALVEGFNHFTSHLRTLEKRVTRIEEKIEKLTETNKLIAKLLATEKEEEKEEIIEKLKKIIQ